MNIICALLLWSALSSGDASAEVDATMPPDDVLQRVYQQYPYVTYRGKLFTFETEFTWPDGYQRLDSAGLSPFQLWVSHMPMWHRDIGVTSLERTTVLAPAQVSRAVHLPWRTSQFKDYAIPLQMLAEYQLMKKREHQWTVHTKGGDSVTYDAFLSSTVGYDARQRLMLRPAEKRQPDSTEFDAFFALVAFNSNYSSLETNADSVSTEHLRPGDLFISRNESGTQGRVYVIMLVVRNDSGDTRYIVATGCPRICDFHIPLFHDDRENPWLTLAEVQALAPEQYPIKGFFRLRVPE